MKGKLYLIATPIGNLEDITIRALRILRECDIIAAEDTRRTRKLLTHYDIHTPLTSYYEENKAQKSPYLLAMLEEGKNVALVSDAGTPGISDPGSDLVKRAISADIKAVPVPGPVAFISALICSGLSTEEFVFLGFPPRKKKDFSLFIDKLSTENRTTIVYEAPHRILNTLSALKDAFPQRKIVAARELTKLHEEFIRGTAEEVYLYFKNTPPKGEFCLVIEGGSTEEKEVDKEGFVEAEKTYKAELAKGVSKKEAIKKTAAKHGLSKNILYQKFVAGKETT